MKDNKYSQLLYVSAEDIIFNDELNPITFSNKDITRLFDEYPIFKPVKKEVKAVVSGIYVLDIKGLHGKADVQPVKKKGRVRRALEAAQEKAGAKPVK